MIEALLLLACLLLLPFFGLTNIPFLLLFAAVLALSVPVLKLIATGAPPYVPTDRGTLDAMMRLAGIRPGETAYDLGCGDGRIVLEAAARGAAATGYELSGPLFLLAKLRSRTVPGAAIRFGDFWKRSYEDADVVFCFLMTKPMERFAKEIWPRLKPGTRVVTHHFKIPGALAAGESGDALLYVR